MGKKILCKRHSELKKTRTARVLTCSQKFNHTVFKISTDLFQVRHGSSLRKTKSNSAKRRFFQNPEKSRKFHKNSGELQKKSYLIWSPVRAFDELCSKFF